METTHGKGRFDSAQRPGLLRGTQIFFDSPLDTAPA